MPGETARHHRREGMQKGGGNTSRHQEYGDHRVARGDAEQAHAGRSQRRGQDDGEAEVEAVPEVADDGLEQRRALQEDGEQTSLGLGEGKPLDENRQQGRQEGTVGVVGRVGGGDRDDLRGLRRLQRFRPGVTHGAATGTRSTDTPRS